MSESFVATHHETLRVDTELPAPLKPELPHRQSIPEEIQSLEEISFSQDNIEKGSTTHIDLEILQENITDAIEAAYSQNSRYSRVFVLLVYWNDEVSDRKHMGPTAQKLGETFKTLFNFDVEEFPIPSRNSFSKMTSKLLQVQDIISDEESNNLFILYYGGHASFKSRGHDVYQEAFWHPSVAAATNTTGKSIGIELSSVESLLADFDSDIFFLFDCCFATGMIQRDRKWRKQCEILGASGSLEKACGEKDKSFTTAVINLLEQQMEGSNGTSVVGLISKLKDRQYLRSLPNRLTTTPDYAVLSQAQSSPIRLIPLKFLPFTSSENTSTSGSSVTTLIDTFDDSDARILFSIALSGMPEVAALTEFFNHRPGTFARIEYTSRKKDDPLLHALFNSDSMLAIVSVPIWLWYLLPQTGAYHYIGIVRSGCLLRGESLNMGTQTKTSYFDAEVQTKTVKIRGENVDMGIQTKTLYFDAKVQTETVKIRGESVDVGSQTKTPYFDAEVQTGSMKILTKRHDSHEEDKQLSLVPHSKDEQEVRLEQAVGRRRVGSKSNLKSHIHDDQKLSMAKRDRGSDVENFATNPRFRLSPISGALPPSPPPEKDDSGKAGSQRRNTRAMDWFQMRPKEKGMRKELHSTLNLSDTRILHDAVLDKMYTMKPHLDINPFLQKRLRSHGLLVN